MLFSPSFGWFISYALLGWRVRVLFQTFLLFLHGSKIKRPYISAKRRKGVAFRGTTLIERRSAPLSPDNGGNRPYGMLRNEFTGPRHCLAPTGSSLAVASSDYYFPSLPLYYKRLPHYCQDFRWTVAKLNIRRVPTFCANCLWTRGGFCVTIEAGELTFS